jgi:hypothetical protein
MMVGSSVGGGVVDTDGRGMWIRWSRGIKWSLGGNL